MRALRAVEREECGAAGRDPVAMMAFSKTRRRSPPCPSIFSVRAIEERGAASNEVDLALFAQLPQTAGQLVHHAIFPCAQFVEIDHRLGELNPQSAAWRDSPMTLATCSNAFEGMQPR